MIRKNRSSRPRYDVALRTIVQVAECGEYQQQDFVDRDRVNYFGIARNLRLGKASCKAPSSAIDISSQAKHKAIGQLMTDSFTDWRQLWRLRSLGRASVSRYAHLPKSPRSLSARVSESQRRTRCDAKIRVIRSQASVRTFVSQTTS